MSTDVRKPTVLPAEKALQPDGSNWIDWKGTIWSLLNPMGLTGHLLGTRRPPESYDSVIRPNTLGATITPWTPNPMSHLLPLYPPNPTNVPVQGQQHVPVIDRVADYDQWVRDDAFVVSTISLNVASLSAFGIDPTAAPEAQSIWYKLRTRYETVNPLLVRDLEAKMRSTMYVDGTDVRDHFKNLRSIHMQALNAGSTLSDADFASVALGTFPPIGNWGQIVPSLYMVTSSHAVESSLVAHKERVDDYNARLAAQAALSPASALQPPAGQGLVANTQRPQCANCGKLGHARDNCWAKGGGKEGQHPPWWGRRGGRGGGSGGGGSSNTGSGGSSSNTTPSSPSAMLVVGSTLAYVASSNAPVGVTYSDSGASHHYFYDKRDFAVYHELAQPLAAKGASAKFPVVGQGLVVKTAVVNGKLVSRHFEAYHAPAMHLNLVSTRVYDRAGGRIVTEKGVTTIHDSQGAVVLQSEKAVGPELYSILLGNPSTAEVEAARKAYTGDKDKMTAFSASQAQATSEEGWHRRLGHNGWDAIKRVQKVTDGLEMVGKPHDRAVVCESCMAGRNNRRPFDEVVVHETELGGCIHIDLFESPDLSIGGKRYGMTLTDDASQFTEVGLMADRSAAATLEVFKIFQAWFENTTGKRIKRVHTDGGNEFKGVFRAYLDEQGILHDPTSPYSPSQNGMAERANRTIWEKVRAMMHDSGLPGALWGEAAAVAVHVHNLVPNSRHPDTSPFELVFKRRPHIEHLRVFGSVTYAHIPKELRRKSDELSARGYLVGFRKSDAYRVWVPEQHRILEARNCVFDEGLGKWSRPTARDEGEHDDEQVGTKPQGSYAPQVPPQGAPQTTTFDVANSTATKTSTSGPTTPATAPAPLPPSPLTPLPATPATKTEVPAPRRSRRAAGQGVEFNLREDINNLHKPPRTTTHEPSDDEEPEPLMANFACAPSTGESLTGSELADIALAFVSTVTRAGKSLPRSIGEALREPEKWRPPIEKELAKMRKYGVWDLVELPPGATILDTMWVFAEKFNAEGEVVDLRARLVGRGDWQKKGDTYIHTSAAVTRTDSFRLGAAIGAVFDMEMWQTDYESAYLNAPIDADIYIRQPRGFEEPGKEHFVCRLNKAIYGFKQSGNNWWNTLDASFEKLGWTRSDADYCVRYKISPGNQESITFCHTDDILGLSTSTSETARAKGELGEEYAMKDAGEPVYMLGIRFRRERPLGRIHLSQEMFARRLLERMGMSECKPEPTPLPHGFAFRQLFEPISDADAAQVKDKPYREVIGALNWLITCTRPDLAWSVQFLAGFSNAHGVRHWQALKHLLRYLKGTAKLGLTYDRAKVSPRVVDAYFDANYAMERDRRSCTGYVFRYAGAAIAWSSKRQPSTAQSTLEAEYMAGAAAARHAIWMHRLMTELGVPVPDAFTLLGDNQGTNKLTETYMNNSRAKHIEVRHHYIRECVQRKQLVVEYVASEDNIADGFTKPLPRDAHWAFVRSLGLEEFAG